MRWTSTALLLASLMIGLAHVAALPPFEGIDETAHYSYVEQIAKTGVLPRLGDKIRMDAQEAYLILGDGPRSLRYRTLFSADVETVERARRIVKARREPPPRGEPGEWQNYEATQHPPFYYALLTPAYLFSERWSLRAQLALLRGLSYFAAWLSLCVAVFAAAKSCASSCIRSPMIIAPALWPFVFPGWFPEMARLGTDSLVAGCMRSSSRYLCTAQTLARVVFIGRNLRSRHVDENNIPSVLGCHRPTVASSNVAADCKVCAIPRICSYDISGGWLVVR
jgi:hypothetical protein